MLERGNHDDLSSLDIVSTEEGRRTIVYRHFRIVVCCIVVSIVRHIRIIVSDDVRRIVPSLSAKDVRIVR